MADQSLCCVSPLLDKSVAFMEYCGFSEEGMCGVSRCSRIVENNWNGVESAVGGPSSDHTNLDTSINGKTWKSFDNVCQKGHNLGTVTY